MCSECGCRAKLVDNVVRDLSASLQSGRRGLALTKELLFPGVVGVTDADVVAARHKLDSEQFPYLAIALDAYIADLEPD